MNKGLNKYITAFDYFDMALIISSAISSKVLKCFWSCIYQGVPFSSAGMENAKCVFNDSPDFRWQEKKR